MADVVPYLFDRLSYKPKASNRSLVKAAKLTATVGSDGISEAARVDRKFVAVRPLSAKKWSEAALTRSAWGSVRCRANPSTSSSVCTARNKRNVEGVLAANPVGSAGQGVAGALLQLDHLRGDQSGWTRDRDGVGPLVLRFKGTEFSGGVVDQRWLQSRGDARDSLCMRGQPSRPGPAL